MALQFYKLSCAGSVFFQPRTFMLLGNCWEIERNKYNVQLVFCVLYIQNTSDHKEEFGVNMEIVERSD